jgi:hypothetical protein
MAHPFLFSASGLYRDDYTNEFSRSDQEGRPYESDIDDIYSYYSDSLQSFETPKMSQQSISESFSEIELSPKYGADGSYKFCESRSTFFDLFQNSDSELDEFLDSADHTTQDASDLHVRSHFQAKFCDERFPRSYDAPVEIVGSTYAVSLNAKIHLVNLARTFKYSPLETSKKSNNITKKTTKISKSSGQSATTKFRNGVPYKIDLGVFGREGSASGNIFSNGKVLVSSIKTDDDELVKSILSHVALSIEKAHSDSMSNYDGAPVILSNSLDLQLSILFDSLSIAPQLLTSVPFRIKYCRLDQAYRDGLLESADLDLVAVESHKEKKTGHGYLVQYDCFSVTIYHTGKIQARTFKPHPLSRFQLKNALLRVHSTLMSIQNIIEVQGNDTFDGSKRRNPNAATWKQVRTSPSPFKPKHPAV